MAKLGFIGLGIMGYPMARHLLAAGHDVALWSHTISKATELASQFPGKATAVVSPKEVAAASECVFFIVGDTAMSDSVVFGEVGLLAGAKPGTVIVDASTVAPSYSLSSSKRCAEKGVHYFDAPCTGSKPGAEKAR